jgi:thiamine pyrophosphate-dependent acetolactate synthase large subunit-like protein
MALNGSQIIGRALKMHGVDNFFYIMGGPMMQAELSTMEEGIRGVDVRHEQAAALMAHAYARLRNRPGICMAASGPGVTNLVTGVAHAWADCTPVIALGGSSPYGASGQGGFQEIDQVTMMEPCTKWSERVYDPARIPEYINRAFQTAMSGKPGPVYLDFPGDVLYRDVEEDTIIWPEPWDPAKRSRPQASEADIASVIGMLEKAERPVIVSGSGIQWSTAEQELQAFVETAGIPFYTTPQSRGVIPEDHEYCYLTARSAAFREADLIFVLGTRMNYVIGHAAPPRFNADAKIVRVDVDPLELESSPRKLDIGVVGDAKAVLQQLTAAAKGKLSPASYQSWRERLGGSNAQKVADAEKVLSNSVEPIHPLRLCKEIRDFLDRDAILVVDGQEILNFGRQSIPTFAPRHRMNSGCFGTMGVGLPMGLGAKIASPDKQVLVLHGDGSFGMNAMEMDTAARHSIPVTCVISMNGGWTADPKKVKPGRDLGYKRYDQMAAALGAHGEYVEKPEDIRGALERAKKANEEGKPALVNVLTDANAGASTTAFTRYVT